MKERQIGWKELELASLRRRDKKPDSCGVFQTTTTTLLQLNQTKDEVQGTMPASFPT